MVKNVFRRLMVAAVACAICVFGSISAFAEDMTAVSEPENGDGTYVTSVDVVVLDGANGSGDDGIMPMSYDHILSGGSVDFSWDGEKSCTLGWRASNCAIKAGISSSDAYGTVTCAVEFPDGSMHGLGTVLASGGMTNLLYCGTLSSGTYTFYFNSSTSATLTGVGYIMQN